MLDQLDRIFEDFKSRLEPLDSASEVLDLKSKHLGKNGLVNKILKNLKEASAEDKRLVGPKAHQIKEAVQTLVQDKLTAIETQEINRKLAREKVDISLLESVRESRGHAGYHPRWTVQKTVEDIFLSMGFEILDGPHIEDEFHNFEALNIPADHPARDMQDTFWFDDPSGEQKNKLLLRTHTSTIQVRGMLDRTPPFRFIAPGMVFRCERTDAGHEMTFCQLEGMMVDRRVSIGHLIYFMKALLRETFGREVKIRLRPGFFPFVEPGFELDIHCLICRGRGCSVCKQTGWVELLPCGMIHPEVLKAGRVDPERWNGFAFGLGLDRLVMMNYSIDDIRHLNAGDLRFHRQFKVY